MKLLLIILTLFFFQAKGQSYVMQWNSKGHTSYVIQKSSDDSTWSTVITLSAKVIDTSFTYTLPLPVKFNYYKVVADSYSSQSIYVNNLSPISIISPNYTEIKLRTQ